MFEDARVHRLAITVQHTLAREAFLWPGGLGGFRNFWTLLFAVLGFSSTDYSPYGIRRGSYSTLVYRTQG